MAAPPPQRLDLCLEGLKSFQEGAAYLKAGDPLCLQPLDGGRLACATRSGAVVGLVPADKRGLLSRGPWSGTVRSVKRHAAQEPVASAAAGDGAQVVAEDAGGAAPAAAAVPPVPPGEQQHEQQQLEQRQHEQQQQQGDAVSLPCPEPGEQQQQQQGPGQQQAQQGQQVVAQVLVRFTPEEQRWVQRGQEADMPAPEEEDAARLSTEQFQALGEAPACRHGCMCRLLAR